MLSLRTVTGISAVLLISVIAGGWFLYMSLKPAPVPAPIDVTLPTTETPQAESIYQRYSVVGSSVNGRPIESYAFGNGSTTLLFVGGIHGGYEWNTVLLAYEAIDYLALNPELLPSDITVVIIPNLNPDGTALVTNRDGRFTLADVGNAKSLPLGTGRFNANDVDLNRNFACKWQPQSTWRGNPVKTGSAAFSEPEAAALKSVVETINPAAAVFWHSQGNAVYGSECADGILPGTLTLMNTYATAANYQAIPVFDAYPITGDAEGWLASLGIPAITVELVSHEAVEWEKNRAGMEAVIRVFSGE